MDSSNKQDYYELTFYTLSLGDPAFIHQHVVDAYSAQTANNQVKDITLCFALAGLFLHVEKGFTGKKVQQAHLLMSKHKQPWPVFDLPEQRGTITVSTILGCPPGIIRNELIHDWTREVWNCFRHNRERIISLLNTYPGLEY